MSANKDQMKLQRRLKRQAEGYTLLKQACQLLGFACATNHKLYSDEPTVGYVIGPIEFLEWVDELQKIDLLAEGEEPKGETK